jgi:hypothetical protein
MLIDQIVADPNWHTRRGMTAALRGRLSKAPKLILSADFAIAADQFRNDFDNLERGRQFCRLPFDECWIEFAEADRSAARRTITTPESMARKKRIGYLLTNTDHDGAFAGRIFISIEQAMRPGASWITAPVDVRYDPHTASFDTAYRHREIYAAGRDALAWWRGEPRYLTAVLELLQSKNATEVALVDLSQLNRQRARRNNSLLFSYHLVSIPARYRQRHIADGSSGQGIRAHYVRGHFKVRRTGIFFWSAYQRGNPALGRVHKDYLLTRPAA